MIGVEWWTSGGKRRCNHNYSGTPSIKMTNKISSILWNLIPTIIITVFLFSILTIPTINGQSQRQQQIQRQQQFQRRPSISPAMEAYRNRWLAYLKARTTSTIAPPTTRITPSLTPPVGVRVANEGNGNNAPLIINGFECERTYQFFPNRDNPRMYHMCARNRDSWFVYHYFCPHGSLFSDGMGKCMQRSSTSGNNGLPGSSTQNFNNDQQNNRRRRPGLNNNNRNPFVTRRPTVAPPASFRIPTVPITPPSTTTTVPTTTTITTTTTSTPSTTSTTSTTTEEPETVPEPDSDHAGVTENQILVTSSEEASTEDGGSKEVDVMVAFPGSSGEQQQSSDEVEYQPTSENEASDEVNMIIIPDESVNGPSRLVGSVTTPSSSSSKQKTKPLKRIPLKKVKIAGANSEEIDDESVNLYATTPAIALGGRRPRILKKIKYWRDFLKGKQQ